MALKRVMIGKAKPAKSTPAPEAAPATAQVASPAPKEGVTSRVPRTAHPVESLYSGPSKGFNTSKSRTKWDHSLFNTQPDRTLTERAALEAKALRDQYGSAPWQRGNFDSGIAKVLLAKGYVQPVKGDGTSETDVYTFTPAAMADKLANA